MKLRLKLWLKMGRKMATLELRLLKLLVGNLRTRDNVALKTSLIIFLKKCSIHFLEKILTKCDNIAFKSFC